MNRAAREEAAAYVAAAGPRLLRTARALTRDVHEAEDLFQDTLVKVYCKWSRVREAEQIDAYVRRIMVNTLLNGRAKASYRSERPHEDVAVVSDLRQVAPDESDAVADEDYALRVLSSLPPMQRAVLTLRYLEDLSDEQIAAELETTRTAVTSAASRGVSALKASISREQALRGSFGTRSLRAVV